METHSNIIAWEIPWTQEPDELQSIGWQRVKWDKHTHTYTRKLTLTFFFLPRSKTKTENKFYYVGIKSFPWESSLSTAATELYFLSLDK